MRQTSGGARWTTRRQSGCRARGDTSASIGHNGTALFVVMIGGNHPMKFVLLFCGTREAQQAFESLSAEDLAHQYERVGQWFADHGAKILSTQQLQSPHM